MALLMTVPGAGVRTAEAFMTCMDDPKRFSRCNRFGSYFGLVPRQDASARLNRLGHIKRDGPSTVPMLLCEAAHTAVWHSPAIRARFERPVRGGPRRRKIAIAAVARQLATLVGAMLRRGEGWRGDDPTPSVTPSPAATPEFDALAQAGSA